MQFYLAYLEFIAPPRQAALPFCHPEVSETSKEVSTDDVSDLALAHKRIREGSVLVCNDVSLTGPEQLLVVTGLDSGGKTTFLRSLGAAQLMMQAGMFVPAEGYRASLCDGVFTHFPRGGCRMERGKLDEELSRMSAIVDRLRPGSVLLLNEAFASTNEREGSEIAQQILRALTEWGVRVFFVVTHLFQLSRSFEGAEGTLFLRAERDAQELEVASVAES